MRQRIAGWYADFDKHDQIPSHTTLPRALINHSWVEDVTAAVRVPRPDPRRWQLISPRVKMGHHQRRRGAVIFFHGSGDTGRGVREWLNSASGGKFERALSDLGLGPVVYPTAQERRYTLAGGAPSTVWFDRERLSPESRQDRAGVLRSLRQV